MSQIRISSLAWCVCILAGVGCASISEDGKEWVATAEPTADEVEDVVEVGELRQAITGTHKMCSCVIGDLWRDTFQAHDGWTVSDCTDYCCDADGDGVGAAHVQAFCMSSGFPPASPPFINFGTQGTCPSTNPIPSGTCW